MEINVSVSEGQNEARARWGTHASGAAFDKKKASYLTSQAQAFIAQQVLCVMAGQGLQGEPRGLIVMGLPGFVTTPNAYTCLVHIDHYPETSYLFQALLHAHLSGYVTHLGLCFIRHATRERLCVQGEAEIVTDNISDDGIWIRLHVQQAFFHCPKYIRTNVAGLTSPAQPRLLPEQLLKLVEAHQTSLSKDIQSFIAQQTVCFLCTVDRSGRAAVNHRGGAPGFLVTQPPSLAIPGGIVLLPDYEGNGAFEALGNILETDQAALVIPSYVDQLALCITGRACVLEPGELPSGLRHRCTGAKRIVVLCVEHVEQQTGGWAAPLAFEYARSQSPQARDERGTCCSF
ncbi:MAG TPA: pyridoxamine 5'-phosphate oxidase family protein [Ktedonobacteraceae bacterium]|jgi:hypothetical protein|nr:pyridoxamine 5'-phosphate oxidase family protein [Ktedonobacteraceae bacterium]